MKIIWANIDEYPEATVTRFLSGLNKDIANIVELQHCMKLEDIMHMTVKVERQLKYKGSSRMTSFTPQFSSRWPKKKEKKGFEAKKSKHVNIDSKGNSKTPTTNKKYSTIKCFKCLGVRHNVF